MMDSQNVCRIAASAMMGLFLGGAVFADDTGSAQGKSKAKAGVATSSVWKITSGKSTVYLAGSVHTLTEAEYPLPTPYETAYKDSDELVFEVDMSKTKDEAAMMLAMKHGTLPDGGKVKDVLKKETYEKVLEYFEDNQIPENMFDILPFSKFKPWLLSLAISQMEMEKLGFNAESGIDKHFEERAKKDKKKIGGLETMEFQLKLLDDLGKEDQDKMVLSTFEELEDFGEEIDSLLHSWRTGDTKALHELMSRMMQKDQPKVYDRLLTQRNKKWIGDIKKRMKSDKKTMFVVGAGHLAGPDSVIAMLKKEGMEAEQMTYKVKPKAKKKGGKEKKPEKKLDPALID